ncbi:radical SAM protein [Planctomycetota bacterium]
MIEYTGAVYRPPSEAYSFILQVTLGCSHNKCSFCGIYRDKPFKARTWESIRHDIDIVAAVQPDVRRVFLADGDALVLSIDRLKRILDYLNDKFPALERVSIYVFGPNFRKKSVADLEELVARKLTMGYLGLESGSDAVLERINKGCSTQDMIDGVAKMHAAGMKTSVIALLGIGGTALSEEHAAGTAKVVSAMNPTFLSFLTVTVLQNTELYQEQLSGDFILPDEKGFLRELRSILAGVDLHKCIFRTNHASNYLPLRGVLNRDRDSLVAAIDAALNDEHPLRPEWMRGL